jgi:hypothetical protein
LGNIRLISSPINGVPDAPDDKNTSLFLWFTPRYFPFSPFFLKVADKTEKSMAEEASLLGTITKAEQKNGNWISLN